MHKVKLYNESNNESAEIVPIKKSPIDTFVLNEYRLFYLRGFYTDLELILEDGSRAIPMKIHKKILMESSPFFKKLLESKGKPIIHPLKLVVEDANATHKIIEGYYGIDVKPKTK